MVKTTIEEVMDAKIEMNHFKDFLRMLKEGGDTTTKPIPEEQRKKITDYLTTKGIIKDGNIDKTRLEVLLRIIDMEELIAEQSSKRRAYIDDESRGGRLGGVARCRTRNRGGGMVCR